MFQREGTTASAGVLFWAFVFAGVAALLFGWYAPHFRAQHGLPLVDIEGALTSARTLELMQAYGPQGRHDYLVFLSLDCVFPVAASLFTIAVFRALLERLPNREWSGWVLRVPALAAVCDLVENTFEAMLTLLFPRSSELLAELALLATLAKFTALCATACVLVALVSLVSRRWLLAR
jgi:hypothetical protein